MRKITTLFFAGLAFLGVAAIGCNGYDQETFTATLNGASEVGPTGSAATGTFSIVFDGPAAKYTLNVTNLAGITAAHIHTGAAGANGNVMVWVYDGRPSSCPAGASAGCPDVAAYTGPLGVGSFTADMVTACQTVGTLPGTCQATTGVTPTRSYDNILADARASTGYVNIHTTTFNGGEIRGQIHP